MAIALCRADLTNDRGLEQLDRSLQDWGQHRSGLVHCAATGIPRSIEEIPERHFDWTFNLNVRPFFKLIKVLMGRFSQGWGAVGALPCYSLVGASKDALEAFARRLAVDWRRSRSASTF